MTKFQHTKLSIIIPAYNEAENLLATLNTLINQKNKYGNHIDRSLYQIIIVNNNSADNTAGVVIDFQNRIEAPKIILVHEKEKGVIPARITGTNYVLNPKNNVSTKYLASGDADVIFHPNWVSSVLQHFKNTRADVLSCAGGFPLSFWKRVPRLARRYLEEIGTIFFDPPTIEWIGARGKSFLFTEQIFVDFIRPVTGACFAISRDAYLRAGGYQREFLDHKRRKEVYGQSWRLVFKLERLNAKIVYVNDAFYNCSPRRLLEEPKKFLNFASYKAGQMVDVRQVEDDKCTRLNFLADKINLEPIRRYIVEYYILLKCVTRPKLIHKNSHYFGKFQEELYKKIQLFWKRHPQVEGKKIFAFGKVLGDAYFNKILASIPRQTVPWWPSSLHLSSRKERHIISIQR